jgi:hypothetical protein
MRYRRLATHAVLIAGCFATMATSNVENGGLTESASGQLVAPDPLHVSVILNSSATEQADELYIEFRGPEGEVRDIVVVPDDDSLPVLRIATAAPASYEVRDRCSVDGECTLGFTVDGPSEGTTTISATALLVRELQDFTVSAEVQVRFDD